MEWVQLGLNFGAPLSILGFNFYLILTGRLVPASRYTQLQQEKEEFKQLWKEERASKEELSNYVVRKDVYTKTASHMFDSLPKPPQALTRKEETIGE